VSLVMGERGGLLEIGIAIRGQSSPVVEVRWSDSTAGEVPARSDAAKLFYVTHGQLDHRRADGQAGAVGARL